MLCIARNGCNQGETVQVKIYYENRLPDNHVWYKYDNQLGWQEYEEHTQLSANKKVVTLRLTDGGSGDQDGKKNMRIVDPSGPGPATSVDDSSSSASSSSSSAGGGGCVYNPQSGFGWEWLLLLPAVLFQVFCRKPVQNRPFT